MPSTTWSPGSASPLQTLPDTDALASLCERIDHDFADPSLLDLAVSHRSWCAENEGHDSNERLEFLGDAVLSMAVTDYIFTGYPELPEGELAKVRASVVSAAALAEVAEEIGLGACIRLGKGEDQSGGREKPSILADGLEAVLGAVYIDGGMDAATAAVLNLLEDRIVAAAAGPGGQDYKTRLQEISARSFDDLPAYSVTDSGPDHAKVFHATVTIDGKVQGRGEGRSKKQAEQVAAKDAWEALGDQLGDTTEEG